MKIAILTMGTQGDVQPFAILGQALKKRGHQVTLSAAKNFEGLVKSYGIDFSALVGKYKTSDAMVVPFRFLWIKQMHMYNFFHIFYFL